MARDPNYYHTFEPDPESNGTVCTCGKGKNHPIHQGS